MVLGDVTVERRGAASRDATGCCSQATGSARHIVADLATDASLLGAGCNAMRGVGREQPRELGGRVVLGQRRVQHQALVRGLGGIEDRVLNTSSPPSGWRISLRLGPAPATSWRFHSLQNSRTRLAQRVDQRLERRVSEVPGGVGAELGDQQPRARSQSVKISRRAGSMKCSHTWVAGRARNPVEAEQDRVRRRDSRPGSPTAGRG